jgi:hypothetical protein
MTEPQPDPTAELMAEIARDFEQPCNIEKVRALLKAGARVDATDDRGNTPLHRCIDFSKDAATAQALIDAGAPLEAKTNENLTPLVSAAWHGRTEIALALIAAKADVNETDKNGTSALLLALNSRHKEIGKALIENGADVSASGFKENMTPLMMAVINDLYDIAPLLLKKGCDIDAVRENQFHDTALGIAREMRSPLAAVIGQEIKDRAVAEIQRLAEKKRLWDEDMSIITEKGTPAPLTVRTLRLKNTRSFSRWRNFAQG